jgi:hypothetical protein
MKKSVILWIIAILLTIALAVYQRVTGPTYPVSGSVEFAGSNIEYTFNRTHAGAGDQIVQLPISSIEIEGKLYWKRFKTKDEWTVLTMNQVDGNLQAKLPHQPSAGKLVYKIELISGNASVEVPQQPVVIRFRSDVPAYILIPHIFFIFGAMLLSTRTGLEIFKKDPKFKKYTNWTLFFIIIGGFILGPLAQKFAFDAYWTGFPFGHDLTDNKILIAFIGWITAAIMLWKSQNPKRWIAMASILLFTVFLIPHSVLGSELDYNKLDKEQKIIEQTKGSSE